MSPTTVNYNEKCSPAAGKGCRTHHGPFTKTVRTPTAELFGELPPNPSSMVAGGGGERKIEIEIELLVSKGRYH